MKTFWIALLVSLPLPSLAGPTAQFQILQTCRGLEPSERLTNVEIKLSRLPPLEQAAGAALHEFNAVCRDYLTNPQQTLSAMRSVSYSSQGAIDAHRAYADAIREAAASIQPALSPLESLGLARCREALVSKAAELQRRQQAVQVTAQGFNCNR